MPINAHDADTMKETEIPNHRAEVAKLTATIDAAAIQEINETILTDFEMFAAKLRLVKASVIRQLFHRDFRRPSSVDGCVFRSSTAHAGTDHNPNP